MATARVINVFDDSPAYNAGLSVDDEILSFLKDLAKFPVED